MRSYFEDIEMHITEELMKSSSSIQLAVAWFTNKRLFDILLFKQKMGVNVDIIINDDNINRNRLYFEELTQLGGQVTLIESTDTLMHLKYCIIDDNILILGSYNWTTKAENKNIEHISIIENDKEEIAKFKGRFLDLKTAKHKKIEKEIEKLRNRLYQIKTSYSFILLGKNQSLLTQRILWKISEQIQNVIPTFYEDHKFNDTQKEECMIIPTIVINIIDLNVNSNHYSMIENSLNILKRLNTANLNKYNSSSSKEDLIFSNVEMIKTIVNNRIKPSFPLHRRNGKILITFNPNALEYVFDMKKGYVKHLANIVNDCTCLHTPLLYLMLKRYVGIKKSSNILLEYNALKKEIGLEGNYTKWSQFSKNVLGKVQNELILKSATNILSS